MSQKDDSRRSTPKKEPVKAARGKAAQNGKEVKPDGRVGKRTPAIVDEILLRVGNGETLRQICREPHMPSYGAWYDWLEKDAELCSRFARARERGEEAIGLECLEIADNAKNDWMEAFGGDDAVAYKLNGEHVQRSKLRIETRLKLLAKWNPKKWGEKVDLNHGVQPENPLAKLLERVAGTSLPIVKDEAGE